MISEVNVTPVKPQDGLVAFASLVIYQSIYLGSIAVHKRLDGSGYRITYPAKKIGRKQLNIYHPIEKTLGIAIEQAINTKCHELFERSDEDGRHSKITVSRRPISAQES